MSSSIIAQSESIHSSSPAQELEQLTDVLTDDVHLACAAVCDQFLWLLRFRRVRSRSSFKLIFGADVTCAPNLLMNIKQAKTVSSAHSTPAVCRDGCGVNCPDYLQSPLMLALLTCRARNTCQDSRH